MSKTLAVFIKLPPNSVDEFLASGPAVIIGIVLLMVIITRTLIKSSDLFFKISIDNCHYYEYTNH